MCLLIVNKSETLPLEYFKTASENNPDGMGIAWTENGRIRMFKHMTDHKAVYRQYTEIRSTNRLPVLIHFRLATHGTADATNVHPFRITKSLAFAHNGVIDAPNHDPKHSDTRHLAELLSKLRDPAEVMEEGIVSAWVDAICGNYSKFAFLTGDGRYKIYNERAGTWDGDTWYSNQSHKAKRETYVSPYVWDTASVYTKAEDVIRWTGEKIPTGRDAIYSAAVRLAQEYGAKSVTELHQWLQWCDYDEPSRKSKRCEL
jgi:predicted glutamine amidotransferase